MEASLQIETLLVVINEHNERRTAADTANDFNDFL